MRSQAFLRDSESDEVIKIQFDKDPERQVYTIIDEQGNSETDRNGNIAGLLKISMRKVEQNSQIIGHFPQRKFILISDSGEHDPEIFSSIKQKFPKQIKEIRIRDILDDKKCHPERLKGMTVISVKLSDGHTCS